MFFVGLECIAGVVLSIFIIFTCKHRVAQRFSTYPEMLPGSQEIFLPILIALCSIILHLGFCCFVLAIA